MKQPAFLEDPKVSRIGLEKNRAYYIPYGSEADALAGVRVRSPRFRLLNGTWAFGYYPSALSLPDFNASDFDPNTLGTIEIPSVWQTRGFASPGL